MIILLFPAGALWAWRRAGRRGLALFSALAIGTVVALALLAASQRGGNRLAQTYGYGYTATRTLLLAALALIVPLIASAASVWATAPRLRPGLVYLIGSATALVGIFVGTVAAIYLIWS
ncbi:MAG: hypothetical protein AB1898_20875 [Acidobacteriota bacterium]